jgi:hypothetical protein
MSNELVCVEMDDTLERVKELFDKSYFYPLRVTVNESVLFLITLFFSD